MTVWDLSWTFPIVFTPTWPRCIKSVHDISSFHSGSINKKSMADLTIVRASNSTATELIFVSKNYTIFTSLHLIGEKGSGN